MCSVGDPVATRGGCQHKECDISATSACFQARPSWGLRGESIYLMNQNWGQQKVWVKSNGPTRFSTSASLSAQLSSRASHAQIYTGCARYFNTLVGFSSSEFGAVHGKQHPLFQPDILFSKVAFKFFCTNFDPKSTSRTRKVKATQWCAQVRKRCNACKVKPWEAYLATFAWERGNPVLGMTIHIVCEVQFKQIHTIQY